jgi:GT2 family glycosyltransferase
MSTSFPHPSVYIIILNWNHKEDLIETMDSFLKQDYESLHIVVADNFSTDDSIEFVMKNYPSINIIRNTENLGWAEGNNVGIRYCLKNQADYIILANNDIYIEDRSLITKIIYDFNSIKNLQNIGIYGVSEKSFYERNVLRSNGWIMYPKYEKYGLTFNKARRKAKVLYDHLIPVDFVGGFFLVLRADIFTKVGYFDSKYFMYAEETDFSLRAWNAGYGSYINSQLTVFHKVAKSSGTNSPFMVYYQTRNLLYLLKKNRTLISHPSIFLAIYIKDFIKNLIQILLKTGAFNGPRNKLLGAKFLGLWHLLVGKMGKKV